MIKRKIIFFILLFISSCKPQIDYKTFNGPQSNIPEINNLFSKLLFKPKIEMFLIFLWPKELHPNDEETVTKIIARSKKISTSKQKYLDQLYKLQSEYSNLNCDCHLLSLCDDGQEFEDDLFQQCNQNDYDQTENDKILVELTQDYNYILEKLKTINATNIDVSVEDDDYLNIGSYDSESRVMTLNKFGFKRREGSLSFKVTPYFENILKARFSFKVDKITFYGNLGITDYKHNVVFSGEIRTSNGREGLVCWEQLK